MNCQEFWESYPELEHPAEAGGHAAQCETCARLLAQQRALSAGLRATSIKWRETEAPERVEHGLVVAFRVHQGRRERPKRIWLPVLTWASAAAVLVFLAVLTIRGTKPMVAPRHVAPSPVQWASATVAPAWASDEDSNNGDFIPLPNAEQVGENEDVNVVRVEVPRSAMLAVGLPVNQIGRAHV